MNYSMIRTDDMLNGSGLRVVLFVSGCNNYCEHCHNPETWDANSGKEFDDEAVFAILSELGKDYIAGITVSGGDPLYHDNLADVYTLITHIKEYYPKKTIWLYTGLTWDIIFNSATTDDFNPRRDALRDLRKDIVKQCDVLVDGKFIESLADVNYPWAGSTNQNVIDVQESLKQNKIVLYNN